MMKITNKYVITCLLILGSSYSLADNSTQSQEQQSTSVMNLAENGDVDDKLLDLFPKTTSNMSDILSANGLLTDDGSKAKDVLVVFHEDGCDFCTDTIGALNEEKLKDDSVINYMGLNVADLLITYKDPEPKDHAPYCRFNENCVDDSNDFLQTDVRTVDGFPFISYYDSEGKLHDATCDTANMKTICACAFKDFYDICAKDEQQCTNLQNAASNYVCAYMTDTDFPLVGGEMTSCANPDWWKEQPRCYPGS